METVVFSSRDFLAGVRVDVERIRLLVLDMVNPP
jgi:hypothetical protein